MTSPTILHGCGKSLPWADSADPRLAQQLVGVVEQLSARVDEHLEDEERSIVPLINTQLSPDEWQGLITATLLEASPKGIPRTL